ncbi:YceD family protein [Paracoccus alkenifer]|uniref:Uncharacterized metal-binding protein YceD, DUF177 family n=1 Tax=Paracoccus alkenifer TaxID=65735 RepID=A0A1H6JHL7_9RHOB|nr:DUF177 domain-containing protein [Paracoccus alkenifer]SEH61820.1 Uncharacterized metal-binding protein YceD, DUF177 family [Paracoccus alkenifer]
MSPAPYSHKLRVSQLNARRATPVELTPDPETRARIAAYLGLLSLPQLRLTGTLEPAPNDSWLLEGRLTAQVEQGCVVTLAPVATTIAEDIRRVYSPHVAVPEGDEVEMPDDETEPLGHIIDPGAVLVEELSLALPLYPRAPGAELPDAATATNDAAEDAAGDTRRPFAGLDSLLRKNGDDNGN